MPMLDIFTDDAFSVTSLTEAINKVPFMPGRAGSIIPWNEKGVTTLTIAIEEKNGVLTLINPSPRGGPGDTIAKQKRSLRNLTIPHYERNDGVMADEVQGVREFGQEAGVMTLRSLIDGRLAEHANDFDVTLEYQRLGAVKGIILNGDGSTLANLFTEFGVSQDAETDFDLDNATPANGALRKLCAQKVRQIENNLDGTPISGVHAFCGDNFFDDLLSHSEVTNSYKNTPMAEVLRQGYVYPNGNQVFGAFEFGGIVWENYRGSIGGTAFVETDKCYLFPVGPSIFRTVFAPADYIETVNTIGLPRYAKQYPMPNDKGVHLEMQMNAMSFCTRPKALLKGKRT